MRLPKNYVAKLGEISVEPHYCSAGSLISDYVEEDNENQSYLQYVKHCVSGLRDVEIYSELDWEQFDAVDSAYKIREAGMFNIPACLDINNIDAIYRRRAKRYIVLPEDGTVRRGTTISNHNARIMPCVIRRMCQNQCCERLYC